jgi:beta-galactosidase
MIDLSGVFLYGAHVYRVPSPPIDGVVEDLATMKRLGMNHANIQLSWSWCNPDDGAYDFDDILRLLSACRDLDLMASITLTLEQMPKWVWDRYPSARLVNALGQSIEDPTQYIMPCDGKPGPCWDHEGVQREVRAFLRMLVEAVADFENLVYWNLWQEIGLAMVWDGAQPAQKNVPFNPETLARFREYLRNRYGTLGDLNKAWWTRYHSWDAVEPPRLYSRVPSFPDWRRFVYDEYLAGVIKDRARMLRDAGDTDRATAFHPGHPVWGSTCEWRWSRIADFYGTSFYPTAALYHGGERSGGLLDPDEDRYHEIWSSLFHLNYSRCTVSDGRFLVSEAASGPYNQGLRVQGEVTADDMRRWLLYQVAAGAQGMILWNTRPEHFWDEAQGQGFLAADGSVTPRAEVAGRFGAALVQHEELLARSVKAPSQVAIGIDDDLLPIAEESFVLHPVRGCYEALFRLGVDPDFENLNDGDIDDLTRRKVIIVPFPFAMSERTVERLSEYVHAGGVLISGPTPARFAENGWAYPAGISPAVQRLFGVEQERLVTVAESTTPWQWTSEECRAGDVHPPTFLTGVDPLDGLELRAAFQIQTFRVEDAQPVLMHGDAVAGTVREYGKGCAWLLGTLFSYAIRGEQCEATRDALERIIGAAGVAGDRQGSVIRQVREWSDRAVWSLINTSSDDGEWLIEGASVEDLLDGDRFVRADRVPVAGLSIRSLTVQK